MRRVFSTSENLGTLRSKGEKWELMAEAASDYDEAEGILNISLDAYLRPEQGPVGEPFRPEWLPAAQVQREHVQLGETIPLAKEVFQNWVRRIRKAAPIDIHPHQGSGL